MIKVLRITNRFNLGGPTFNVAYLTKYLGDEFETLLIGGEKDDSEDSSTFILDQLGITPVIIPEMKRPIDPKMDYLAYKKISEIIKEFKPDIVHTHASKSGAIGRLAAANLNVPQIYHTFHGHVFHSYFGKLKTEIYKNLERYAARKCTKIIAISEKQKIELSEIHKICTADKIEVVPLGFDLSKFRENKEEKRVDFRKKYKLEKEHFAIGIVGRLVPIKQHKMFLDAFKALKTEHENIKGFIIGDGEVGRDLKEYSKSIGLELGDNVSNSVDIVFTSWIRNVDWAYAGLDLIALTSLNEGTPVSLIEAQAAGKAIVATDVGGVSDVVKNGITGIITKNNTTEEIQSSIHSLISNSELRTTMEANGWLHVEKFSHLILAKNIRNLYLEDLP